MPSVVTDRVLLVTGGAGSFGRAFTEYALVHGVKRVIVFSRDEEKHRAMRQAISDARVDFFVGDVRDLPRLTMACEADVDIVIHAAAQKQVPSCEFNPLEAVKTNVLGTMNVVEATRAAYVPKVVFLSTDKAPEASTTYGKTKALAEAVIVRGNAYSGRRPTRFAATRYGNVAGSTGSVIPIFLEQRARGELTVTDVRATRFWMPLSAAVELVVWTIAHMCGGEIVVPKVIASRVADVAKAIGPDCVLKETGLRPAEKLHEILVAQDEVERTYDCGEVFVIAPLEPTWAFTLPANATKVPYDFRYCSDEHATRTRVEFMSGQEHA